MTKNLINIILCLLIIIGCTQPIKKQKKQLEKDDYWVVDFKSGDYPSKTYNSNKVYCSSIQITSGLPNFLYCFDLGTGKVIWRKKVDSWGNIPPIIQDSLIYYCSYTGTIYSLNADGEIRWEKSSSGSYATHKINPINNNLFVSTVETGVYEYDYDSGNVINHIGNRKLGVTLPAISDSLICFANLGKGDTEITGNQLICFNYFTKDTIWQREFKTEEGRSYNKIEKLYSDSNYLYFIQGKSTLYCLDFYTGKSIWTTDIDRNHNEKIVFRGNSLFIKTEEIKSYNKLTGKETSLPFKRTFLEREILVLPDSIRYTIICEIGNFTNNSEFDSSCDIELKNTAANRVDGSVPN